MISAYHAGQCCCATIAEMSRGAPLRTYTWHGNTAATAARGRCNREYNAVQIASACDVMSMSDEGVGGAFVNPHGYVHDMITLRKAKHVTLEGERQLEHSWFKGYAWTIAYCGGCTSHLVSFAYFIDLWLLEIMQHI